jgi:hypothetical protein
MPETLQKLRPDRDLQCYYLTPTAIAALSQSSPTGFTVSGTWRQQFDWAVIEWNRDNTFEHPLLRNLPDGDLSGLQLSYRETRENCIPLDSTLFPTVDWPTLRLWDDSTGTELIYAVPLAPLATAVAGSYVPASAVFTLQGSVTVGDYVEVSWLAEHYTYLTVTGDTLESAVQAIANAINADVTSGGSPTMSAAASAAQLTLTYLGTDSTGELQTAADSTTGENGNRLGAYANVTGAATESWSPVWQYLSGGTSPTQWQVALNFTSLTGWLITDLTKTIVAVPASSVRKLRWTYAADFQVGAYARSEFQVTVSNWTVSGTGLAYQAPGPQSRRVEDDSTDLVYSGTWAPWPLGNYSGGSIRYTTTSAASVSYTYTAAQAHSLYLGTWRTDQASQVSIVIDGVAIRTYNLYLFGEDVLVRILLADLAGGVSHTVTITQTGSSGHYFFFDFFEIAVKTQNLPVITPDPQLTLATDWDTYHSQSLAAERTAWIINTLGFTGRANHYAGALWFYELVPQGFGFASGTMTFSGTPIFSEVAEIEIGLLGTTTTIQHQILIGDTLDSLAKAFELLINNGFTGIRATSSGAALTIYDRAMGSVGNAITLSADIELSSRQPGAETLTLGTSGAQFSGGADGTWLTDLTATPRINRAARDWSVAYFTALKSYGIDVAAAFSMELGNGDASTTAGIAQRYSDGDPVQLNTPAVQTNFSPTSLAFWKQAHLDMANLMNQAGCVPYLQFGEVQWWYFTYDWDLTVTPYPTRQHDSLPLYDDYTTSTFNSTYGRAMHVFTTTSEDPTLYADESQFLPGLIASFTSQIMSFVHGTYPSARFEVLYPPDTNDSAVDQVLNLPASWTPSVLNCFKTENFTFTGNRDMNAAVVSIQLPMQLGFLPSHASHLVGIGDYTTPWLREVRKAKGQGVESVVLFALDQFCLIGYPAPLPRSSRRSLLMSQ